LYEEEIYFVPLHFALAIIDDQEDEIHKIAKDTFETCILWIGVYHSTVVIKFAWVISHVFNPLHTVFC